MLDTASKGPLAPFRVLDLTGEIGQLAGRLLAELGADVIKLEAPQGDPARWNAPFYHDEPHPERSLFWWTFNHSKRGATLDLNQLRGRDLFLRLVDHADFVIESSPPGAMDGIGLGWSAIHTRNPRVVMTSITPFGQSGPYAQWSATDLIGVAMGGLASLCGSPGRPPIRPSAAQGYTQASAQAVVGTMIAHYHRTATGRGQHVDQSMQEAVTFTHDNAMPTWDIRGVNIGRPGNGRNIGGYQSGQYIFEAADGYVAALSFGGLFGLTARQTVEWLDRHGMAEDLNSDEWLEKLDASQGAMVPPIGADSDHLIGILSRFCKRFSRAQLVAEAQQIRNGWGIVHTPADLLDNEHLIAREYWTELEHEDIGRQITYPGPWAKLSATPLAVRRRAPRLGEHNSEIYGDLLGLAAAEIADLTDQTVI